ncbi:8-amino-7-oxononanoate synthase 1 [Bacteroidia bacterium]|nr:8-amino-7-oxononanoate synthase 1 [Bacteroidia bacterium]
MNEQPARTPFTVFAGNDYLGLAKHPALIQAATDATLKYGVNFYASRNTTGTSEIHLELERLLSDFKGQADTAVFASGYLGNRLLLQALKEEYSIVFADSQAHPSILEAIPAQCVVHFYRHCSPEHLEELLKANPKEKPLIITDGIFALSGEIAPLDALYALADKYHAALVVDDAHATGVLGNNGRGTPEHFYLDGAPNLYQSETMSKALGAYGGFISSSSAVIDWIRSKSLFYGASTALPPPIVAAACASLKLIGEEPERRERLKENAAKIRNGVRELGFSTNEGITPIIPILFAEEQQAYGLSSFLKEHQLIAPAVKYPIKMNHFIVRITVTANHSESQIDYLLDVLKKWRH